MHLIADERFHEGFELIFLEIMPLGEAILCKHSVCAGRMSY